MILESPAKKHAGLARRQESWLPTVNRSARVPYTAEQMFDLVNDIERYPEFLHWCSGAHIDARQSNTVEATLNIGLLGFRQSFRTRNTLQRPSRIQIELVSGPFRRLRGEWRFTDSPPTGSDVTLALAFEVTVSPFGVVFAKVFEELAGAQMNAFVHRAAAIYGPKIT
jgi:ribosome-associated toxin RatA of RatAB toxin-antitoxin module